MGLTVKDFIITILLTAIVYYAVGGDKPNNYVKVAHRLYLPKIQSPNKVEKVVSLQSLVDRPSVEEVPVYNPQNLNQDHSMDLGGNVIISPNGQIKSSDDIKKERKHILNDYATGKITKAEFDKKMSRLKSEAPPPPKIVLTPLTESSRANDVRLIEKLRYEKYLQECVQEKLGQVPDDTLSEVVFSVSDNGELRSSTLVISRHRPNFIEAVFGIPQKDVLLAALEKAAPFQPSPSAIGSLALNYKLYLSEGEVSITPFNKARVSGKQKWYKASKKSANPKRVEDVKVTEAQIRIVSYNSKGQVIYASQPFLKSTMSWYPVTDKNNTVAVTCTIKNGKLVDPIFMKKSDIREANEAALDAMYTLVLPNISHIASYPSVAVKVEGVFTVR